MTPTLTAKKPAPRNGGGRGPVDYYRGDGGGGGRGDGAPDYGERLRRYRLGLAVGLTSIVMVFVSFTSAYIVRQGLGTWDFTTGKYVHDWQKLPLPLALLLLNTGLLLTSSVTMELARRRAAQDVVLAPVTSLPGITESHQKPVPWLWITLVLGFGFLAGQALAWSALVHRGLLISSNPSSSFFYVLTGTHAAHLAGGIIALLYAALISTRVFNKPVETRRIVVDVTGWYWHVMALLWLYIFALMAFAG
ncbi:MAG: heme-copper oxidase subunit III [Terriglobales bacterium]